MRKQICSRIFGFSMPPLPSKEGYHTVSFELIQLLIARDGNGFMLLFELLKREPT